MRCSRQPPVGASTLNAWRTRTSTGTSERAWFASVSTDQFAHRVSNQPTHICDEPVVIGSSDEPTNYGSFLFRTMPKILAARHLDPDITNSLMPLKYKSFRDLCLLAGLSEDRLIAHDDRATLQVAQGIPAYHSQSSCVSGRADAWPIFAYRWSASIIPTRRRGYSCPGSGWRVRKAVTGGC